jgi:hypothetical protein
MGRRTARERACICEQPGLESCKPTPRFLHMQTITRMQSNHHPPCTRTCNTYARTCTHARRRRSPTPPPTRSPPQINTVLLHPLGFSLPFTFTAFFTQKPHHKSETAQRSQPSAWYVPIFCSCTNFVHTLALRPALILSCSAFQLSPTAQLDAGASCVHP